MSQANRREHPRRLRRVQVRFSRQGEERTQHGFTKNLSLSGALISSPDPPPRGSRLRLELLGKDGPTVIYGDVVHAHRVPAEMRRFADSVMGVRFVETRDLVSPYLPDDARGVPRMGEGPGAQTPVGDGGSRRARSEPAAPSAPGGGPRRVAEPSPGPASGAPAEPAPSSGVTRSGPTYSLLFEQPSEFLTVFHRDISNGGLFVATDRPAKMYQPVSVVLHLPGEPRKQVTVSARVVQVIEPRRNAGGKSRGGMGLEILDVDRTLDTLVPIVEELRG